MTAHLVDNNHTYEAPAAVARPREIRRSPTNRWQFAGASKWILSIADQCIVSGTSFATTVIVGRATSPDQMGVYYLTASMLMLALGVQENTLSAPYTIYCTRLRRRELAEYSGSVWVHHAVLSLIGVGLLLASIVTLSVTGETELLGGLWALVGAGPLILLREWIRRLSYANLHVRSAIMIDTVVAIAQLSGLLALWGLGLMSTFSIFAVMGAACALACLGWFLLSTFPVRFDRHRFLSDWKRNWCFAKWALRSYLVGDTAPFLMPWILHAVIGTSATGKLGACVMLVGATKVLLSGVGSMLTPQAARAFAQGGIKQLVEVLLRTASMMTLVMGGFVVVSFVAGDRLAVWVYGDQYLDCGLVITTLAISTLMGAMNMIVGNGLWAIDRPRANFPADVVGLTAMLVGAIFLVGPFDALGGAIAMLAGTTSAAGLRTFMLYRSLTELAIHSKTLSATT